MSHISDADLQAYLDDEVVEAQRGSISDHLADCATCRVRLERFEKLYSRIESIQDGSIGIDLAPAVIARLSPRRPISRRGRWLLAAELALGVATMAAALGWINPSPPPWIDGLALSLQAWTNLGDPTAWLSSLAAPVDLGLSLVASISASVPLGSALSVTGWAMLLAGCVVAGLAANGFLLTRVGGQRREDTRSA